VADEQQPMPARLEQLDSRRPWRMDHRLTLRLPSRVMSDLQLMSVAAEEPVSAVARRLLAEQASAAADSIALPTGSSRLQPASFVQRIPTQRVPSPELRVRSPKRANPPVGAGGFR
jgi:hypothetical protein